MNQDFQPPVDESARVSNTIDQLYGVVDAPDTWPALTRSLLDLLEVLGDATSADDRHPEPGTSATLLDWLSPHLLRVLQQQQVLFAQQDLIDFQGSLLDQHHLAIGVFDARGRVLWANRNMHACMANLSQNALAALVAPEARRPATHAMLTEGGKTTLLALSAPALGAGYVALLASTPYAVTLEPASLKALFGFTDAEVRIAQGLASGFGPDTIAEQHGNSVHTVRSQIKQVLGKAGANRQSELVARLMTSPASMPMHDALPADYPPALLLQRGERQLGYVDLGPRDGLPVFFMHSWAGSRLQSPPDHQTLYTFGVRLIVPERPGMGRSSPAREGGLHNWPGDVSALADHLELKHFALIGYSLGCVFALATAAALPEHVTHLALIAPTSPLRELADLKGMLPSAKLLLGLSMRVPAVIPALLRLWMARMRRHPELYLESILPHLSPRDAAVLRNRHLQAHYQASFQEAIIQGDEALLNELRIMSSDWSHLLSVALPVTLWHGEDDRHAPILHSERLLARLPDARLERVPDSGHYLLYHCWERIIEALVADAQPGGRPFHHHTPSGV